jgi:hypothetical protein
MLFLIFIMKIYMEEKSGFLTTLSPLRPRTEGSMRLCVKFFERMYAGTGGKVWFSLCFWVVSGIIT